MPYVGRVAYGTETLAMDLVAEQVPVLMAEDCLVMPVVRPGRLQPVVHGDPQTERIVNSLGRQGSNVMVEAELGNAYLVPASSEDQRLYHVRATLAGGALELFRVENDSVNALLRRWGLRRRGVEPAIDATAHPLPAREAFAAVDVMKSSKGLAVKLGRPAVLEVAIDDASETQYSLY